MEITWGTCQFTAGRFCKISVACLPHLVDLQYKVRIQARLDTGLRPFRSCPGSGPLVTPPFLQRIGVRVLSPEHSPSGQLEMLPLCASFSHVLVPAIVSPSPSPFPRSFPPPFSSQKDRPPSYIQTQRIKLPQNQAYPIILRLDGATPQEEKESQKQTKRVRESSHSHCQQYHRNPKHHNRNIQQRTQVKPIQAP